MAQLNNLEESQEGYRRAKSSGRTTGLSPRGPGGDTNLRWWAQASEEERRRHYEDSFRRSEEAMEVARQRFPERYGQADGVNPGMPRKEYSGPVSTYTTQGPYLGPMTPANEHIPSARPGVEVKYRGNPGAQLYRLRNPLGGWSVSWMPPEPWQEGGPL